MKPLPQYPQCTAPAAYHDAMTTVLDGFPELHNIQIHVRETSSGFGYASRPDLSTLFRPPAQRTYLILINQDPTQGLAAVMPDRLPAGALVGILAHEVSHTVYYLHKTWFGMLGFGMLYAFLPAFRRRTERRTDITAMQRGFQHQLYTFRKYSEDHLPASHLAYMKKYYLSSDEIATHSTDDRCPTWLTTCLAHCTRYESLLSFGLITGIGGFIDIILFFIMYDMWGWELILSNILAFSVSVVWNFFVSRQVSFRDDTSRTGTKLGKYSLTAVGSLAIDTAIVWAAITLLGAHSFWAKIFGGWGAFIWSYTMNKLWTFKEPKPE